MKKLLLLLIALSTILLAQELIQNKIITQSDFAQNKFEETRGVQFADGKIISNQTEKENSFVSNVIVVPLLNAQPFLTIALNCEGEYLSTANAKFYLRYSEDGNNFSGWIEFDVDDDNQPVNGGVSSALLFLTERTKFIQYKILTAGRIVIEKINIWFSSPGKTPQNLLNEIKKIKNEIEATDSLNDFPKPAMVTRTQWGCPQGQGSQWSPSYMPVSHLIVHHSAGANTASDWAAVVRSIWNLHTNTNGWGDVGYNFLIAPDGTLFEGRSGGDDAVGAHFCGYNNNTMGTCMIGTYTSVPPTTNSVNKLISLLTWKTAQKGIHPLQTSFHAASNRNLRHISGHRDGCSTECPGTITYNTLPSIQQNVFNNLTGVAPRVYTSIPNGVTNFAAFKSIFFYFSAGMDTASVRQAITISPGDTVKFVWTSNKTLEVRPLKLWAFSTSFQIKIDSSAKNVYGTNLDGNRDGFAGDPYFFNFTTTSPDLTPPRLIKYYPVGDSVSLFASMKFVFDEPIDGLGGRIFLLDENNANMVYIDAKYSVEDERGVVTFRPQNIFGRNKNYKVQLKAGLKDSYGNAVPGDSLYPFTTEDRQFVQGNVFDQFEVYGSWTKPMLNDSTKLVDSSATDFTISNEKKFNGTNGGKIAYKFSTSNGGVVQLFNGWLLAYHDSLASLGLWVFGDLSANQLELWLNTPTLQKISFGKINWFGWKFLRLNLSSIPGSTNQLHSVIVRQTNDGDKSGVIYVDDLQHGADFTTSLKDEIDASVSEFKLYQNHPNPFNPSTKIRFSIPTSPLSPLIKERGIREVVTLKVYDILGQEIVSLVNELKLPGVHEVDFSSNGLPSGIYFYQLRAGSFVQTKKMILIE